MATHSSVLAWRIPVMGEPCGLPSMGSHRVGHNWSDLAAAAAAAACTVLQMYILSLTSTLNTNFIISNGFCYTTWMSYRWHKTGPKMNSQSSPSRLGFPCLIHKVNGNCILPVTQVNFWSHDLFFLFLFYTYYGLLENPVTFNFRYIQNSTIKPLLKPWWQWSSLCLNISLDPYNLPPFLYSYLFGLVSSKL